jgi:hypothetical protein
MHCPQCGQKQASAEVHFCNSCGFPLDRVKELLAGDSPSTILEEESQKSVESPRRKGVRQGVIFFFICLATAALTSRSGNPRAQLVPIMFFLAALMRIVYAVFFQEGAPRKKRQDSPLPSAPSTTEQLGAATRGPALPPAQGVPVAAFKTRRVETAEMVNPPSVTEHTTKLLNESKDSE